MWFLTPQRLLDPGPLGFVCLPKTKFPRQMKGLEREGERTWLELEVYMNVQGSGICQHFSLLLNTYCRLEAVLVSWCPGPLSLWCPHTSTALPADTALVCSPHQGHRMAHRHAGSARLHIAQPHILRGLEKKTGGKTKFQSHLHLIPSFAYFWETWKKKKKKKV